MDKDRTVFTLEEYNKLNIYMPLILPEAFLEHFKDVLSKDEVKELKDDKVVLISGWWCILSKKLPVCSGKSCPTCHADLPPNHPLRKT